MKIDFIPVTEHEVPTVENLIQLYLYEFTAFEDWDVETNGRFSDADLDGRLLEAGRRCFIVMVDDRVAGFTIIDQPVLPKNDYSVTVREFFILRRYQKKGIGTRVACEMFDRFPGRWLVRELPRNRNAIAFWRKVIAAYTDGQYKETIAPDGDIVQYFDNQTK